jgi:hypothetical protein
MATVGPSHHRAAQADTIAEDHTTVAMLFWWHTQLTR